MCLKHPRELKKISDWPAEQYPTDNGSNISLIII